MDRSDPTYLSGRSPFQDPHVIFSRSPYYDCASSPHIISNGFYNDQYADRLYHYQQLEHRRQLLEKRKQEDFRRRMLMREAQAQNERVQRKKKQARKAKILSKYIKSAILIQRSFRKSRHIRMVAKLNRAARVIMRAIRAFPKIRQARCIAEKIASIRDLRNKIITCKHSFHNTYDNSLSTKQKHKVCLQHEDDLIKIQLEADRILTEGNEILKTHRKQLIYETQQALDSLDILIDKNSNTVSDDDFSEAMGIFEEVSLSEKEEEDKGK